ncbi:hypothetical protein BDV59DRAFT_200720 [Aspergillus ambiguus]|uniref:phosphotransferase family protein n=1 Tax=Aspergillus ambiguus TaxID=176160 RepID=UPI003CCD0083
METNAIIDLVHEVQGQLWVDRINDTYRTGRLCQWVSTFHPQSLPCQLNGSFHHGAFNAGMKMVFSDDTAWMVRFPRKGMICDQLMDEKVAMEVSALSLIQDNTTIPVPKVHAWGPAASNPLGLGPFIMMDFIDGVSLSDILRDPEAQRPSRVIRENIGNDDIEIIYRQMANFLLQLFRLDFSQIGSLPPPQGQAQKPTPLRPLTLKAHTILQNGGVDTFGDRSQGFATTTEYFQYVVGQDWEQLIRQPNSVVGFYGAQNEYSAFKVLKSLIPDFVYAKDDLTIIGVVDLEWSYMGPAQLFGSAPWWLLQDRPVNSAWDWEDDEPPKIGTRYLKYLEIFMRVLEEEEAKLPEAEDKELSTLVKWSQSSGAMWLHMLLSSGFNGRRSFPFTQLRLHLGPEERARREKQFDDPKEREEFAARKVNELDKYDEDLEKIEERISLLNRGHITKEDFIASTPR